jgi:hypothetical protein
MKAEKNVLEPIDIFKELGGILRPDFSKMVTGTVEMIDRKLTELDLSEVDNMDFEDIDHNDYPDYCDAYCSSADYKGVPMTEVQLDLLNDEYRQFVYDKLISYLY